MDIRISVDIQRLTGMVRACTEVVDSAVNAGDRATAFEKLTDALGLLNQAKRKLNEASTGDILPA